MPGVDVTGGAVTGVKDDRRSHDEVAGPPHGDMVAQPHSEDEGPVAEAEQLAAKLSLAPRSNRWVRPDRDSIAAPRSTSG